MYRAYIKNLEDLELEYAEIPHKGHFVYGNLIESNPNDAVDAIVGNLIEITDEYVSTAWWCSIEKGSSERYTGMKDINGKKIYENDLVRLTDDLEDPIYKVIFDEAKFEISGGGVCYDLGEEFMDCEIIGDVHTDGDLIDR